MTAQKRTRPATPVNATADTDPDRIPDWVMSFDVWRRSGSGGRGTGGRWPVSLLAERRQWSTARGAWIEEHGDITWCPERHRWETPEGHWAPFAGL